MSKGNRNAPGQRGADGVRLNPWHDARSRTKIQTSQLINRLTAHALGGVDPKTKRPVELTTSQVKAIEILLRKTLPDLQAIAGQISHHVTHEEWLKELE